jgi:Ulp1 family protease
LKKIILILLLCNKSFSQKIIEKEIAANHYKSIEISSDKIHHINLISTDLNTISIITRIEGQDHESVVLSLLENNNILFIKPDTTPFFKSINDKLAAHKVQSIEIELKLPKRLGITINSKIASLTSTGSFNFVVTSMEQGNCTLINFEGNANLSSKSGFINVSSKANIKGDARSKSGFIINELSDNLRSNYKIIAETKDGDISLIQIH